MLLTVFKNSCIEKYEIQFPPDGHPFFLHPPRRGLHDQIHCNLYKNWIPRFHPFHCYKMQKKKKEKKLFGNNYIGLCIFLDDCNHVLIHAGTDLLQGLKPEMISLAVCICLFSCFFFSFVTLSPIHKASSPERLLAYMT